MHKIHQYLSHALHILLLTTLTAFACPVLSLEKATPQLLRPYTAEYVLRKKGFKVALLRHHLVQQQTAYIFTVEAYPKGLATLFSRTPIKEKSILEWQNGKLIPLSFQRIHDGKPGGKIKEMRIDYNQRSGQAEVVLDDKTFEFAIKNGLWDTSSVQLALMVDLARGLKTLDYHVIDDDELSLYHYTVESIEKIESPTGVLHTVKLEYKHNNRQTLLWCDINKGFVPVKIERYKKGKLDAELVLQSIKFESQAITSNQT